MKRFFIIAALAATLGGCTVYASAPDIAHFKQLRPGAATFADAERLMGKPAAMSGAGGSATSALWVDDGKVIDLKFDAAGRYRGVLSEAGF